MELNRRNIRVILGIVAFAIALLAVLWNLGTVWEALRFILRMTGFFITGLSIAFMLNTVLVFVEGRLFKPLNKRLGKRWLAARRPAAVALTVLFIVGILFAVVFMVIPELARTFVVLGEQVPVFWEQASIWIAGIAEEYGRSLDSWNMPQLDWVKIGDTLLNWLQNGASSLVTGTFNMATSVVSGIVNMVVGFVVAVYVLYQKERLSNQAQRALYAYIPEKRVDRLLEIGRLAHRTFCNFISGQFTEAVILGVLCFFGMRILGFPFAPMVSVLVGVTAVIPIFGAFIGTVIGAFMILVNQGVLQAFWFIVFFFALQQVEGNLIYPHVVGKKVMLPGLWVLVAVTLGANVAGVAGMLISVPLASLLYALLKESVNRRNAMREAER